MDIIYANDFYYLGLVVLFPLIGAIINGIFGSKLPRAWVDWIACTAMFLSFLYAMLSVRVFAVSGEEVLTYEVFQWIYTGSLTIDLAFMLDPLSSVMLLVITGVGFLIHIYSTGYMADDPAKWKYFSYLNLFVFAMLLLVLGKNLLVTFIGWEGVGACSYLLIGFWYTDDAKAAAGQKAFIVNRIGDFAFILGILLLYTETGSFDYLVIDEMASNAATAAKLAPIAVPAVLLIFIGCTGKSAQLPLYTWLPDAMAGPTPVSALIHAATMVTSGVYLLARLNTLVTISYQAMLVIAVVGALTAFFAATMALVQNDIKGVLAYSTVSQLGYMFIAIGVGSFVGAIFHLMTHAFFKALLFLGSGSVIHSMGGDQDIRNMGGLRKWMPYTAWTFLIACVAIAGVPFLGAGFFSKDLILWGAFSNVHVFQVPGAFEGALSIEYLTSTIAPAVASGSELAVADISKAIYGGVYVLGIITAGLTAFYMFRLYFLTFEGECRADAETQSHLHESPQSMTIPLSVLAVLSAVGGLTGWPHAIAYWVKGLGESGEKVKSAMLAFEYWLAPVFEVSTTYRVANRFGDNYALYEGISIAVGSTAAITGIAIAWFLYVKNPNLPKRIAEQFSVMYRLLQSKYKVDEFYDIAFVRQAINVGKGSYEFDGKVLDGFLVNGVGFMAESFGKILRHLQSGDTQRYATYLVLAIILAFIALL